MLIYRKSDFDVDVPVGRFNLGEFMSLLYDRRRDISVEDAVNRKKAYQHDYQQDYQRGARERRMARQQKQR